MKKYKIVKVLSACVAIVLLAAAFPSCGILIANSEPPEYIERQRLEVEDVKTEYTPEQAADISKKLADTAAAILRRRDGLEVDAEDLADIRGMIETDIIPSLQYANVSYPSVIKVADAARETINRHDTAFDPRAYSSLYLMCMSELGREKSGELIYRSALMYLDHGAEVFEERYKEYGYDWYLADAEKYRSLASGLRDTVGVYEFTDAISIAFFAASALSGTPVAGDMEGALYLDSKEMLVLLEKQAEMIAEHKISSEQWTVLMSFVFEVCYSSSEPQKDWNDVQKAEYLALKNCPEYAERIGTIMPKVSALYVAAIDKLSVNRLSLIMSGNDDVASMEILKAVSQCKNEFIALAREFERCESFASDYEREALELSGAVDDYNKYSKYRKPVNFGQLYEALNQFVYSKIDSNDFRRVWENYMYTNAPYFTYAFIHLNK